MVTKLPDTCGNCGHARRFHPTLLEVADRTSPKGYYLRWLPGELSAKTMDDDSTYVCTEFRQQYFVEGVL